MLGEICDPTYQAILSSQFALLHVSAPLAPNLFGERGPGVRGSPRNEGPATLYFGKTR